MWGRENELGEGGRKREERGGRVRGDKSEDWEGRARNWRKGGRIREGKERGYAGRKGEREAGVVEEAKKWRKRGIGKKMNKSRMPRCVWGGVC